MYSPTATAGNWEGSPTATVTGTIYHDNVIITFVEGISFVVGEPRSEPFPIPEMPRWLIEQRALRRKRRMLVNRPARWRAPLRRFRMPPGYCRRPTTAHRLGLRRARP